MKQVRVRLHPDDSTSDLFLRAMAARLLGCQTTVSKAPGFDSTAFALLEELTQSWAGSIEFLEETDDQLTLRIRDNQADRVRYAAPDRVPLDVQRAANEAGGIIVSRSVSSEGRLELLWYVHEQSLSVDYHRYGNLGVRAQEERAPVL